MVDVVVVEILLVSSLLQATVFLQAPTTSNIQHRHPIKMTRSSLLSITHIFRVIQSIVRVCAYEMVIVMLLNKV